MNLTKKIPARIVRNSSTNIRLAGPTVSNNLNMKKKFKE